MSEKEFALQNIYTKDVSFEAPNNPGIFKFEWNPKVDFDMQIATSKVDENHYEISLHFTVTNKLLYNKDGKEERVSAFIAEINQAGLFTIKGFSDQELDHILHVVAPEVIFPYVREAISSLVLKGGFPQLLLPPMNFQAMYEQSKQQAAAEETSPGSAVVN